MFRADQIDMRNGATKLLIAEDDLLFQRLLKKLLSPYYSLIVVSNGDDAWKELQRPGAPRMAILDWVMPGFSGPQLCRKVRALEAIASTYLILFTAKNNETDIVSGLRSGADDYITKPPLPAELLARIKVGERILALQDAVRREAGLPSEVLPAGITLPDSISGKLEDRSFTSVIADNLETAPAMRAGNERRTRTVEEEPGLVHRVSRILESRHFTR